MTSSISPGSTPARFTASFTARAARSSGRTWASAPPSLPTGVRTALTMTTSRSCGIGWGLLAPFGISLGAGTLYHRVHHLFSLRLQHEVEVDGLEGRLQPPLLDRKSTRLNSSHVKISYAVFCLKKKKK